MAKLFEGLVDRNVPLINESLNINETLIEDYVLVLSNPFDVGGYTVTDFTEKIPQKKLEKYFLRLFKIDKDDKILSEFLQQVKELQESASEIIAKDLAKIVAKAIFEILQEYLGFLIKAYLSADKDQIFILIRSSEHNLKVQADLIDYKLQFNEENSDINKNDKKSYQDVLPFGPFEKSQGGRNSSLMAQLGNNPEKLYQKYDSEANPSSEGEFFRFNDRVRIVRSMLASTFELGELINFGLLSADFPLNSKPSLNYLMTEWATLKSLFKSQPIEKIRNYYGEKITLYFAWLEYYIYWLLTPSLFGTIIAIVIFATGGSSGNTIDSVCFLLFSLLLGISSTFMDQLWIRRENFLAWTWGLSDFEETEEQRPEHKGKYRKDEVSGKMKKIYQPVGLEKYAMLMGYSVILFFVGIVIAALVAIFTYRNQGNDNLHKYLPGIVNAVQIKVLNFVNFI